LTGSGTAGLADGWFFGGSASFYDEFVFTLNPGAGKQVDLSFATLSGALAQLLPTNIANNPLVQDITNAVSVSLFTGGPTGPAYTFGSQPTWANKSLLKSASNGTFSQPGLLGGTYTLQFSGTKPLGAGGYAAALGWSTVNVTPVPEPETFALLLAGLGVLAGVARRRGQPA
jgi:hypothetical protein